MSGQEKRGNTALVLLDIQHAGVAYTGENPAFLKRLSDTVATAREADISVIHVMVHFREGYPEVNPHNRFYSGMLKSGMLQAADMSIHPAVAPQPGEVVVTKTRAGAFSGTDMDVVLRSQDINHLVLCGITTSNAVLATVVAAADRDYKLTVLSDCCADKEDVQSVLMTRIFPQWAEVVTAEDWNKRVSEGNY